MKHKYCGKTLDFPRKPWISGDLRHYKGATWICENDYPAVDGLTVEPIKAKVDSESVGFYIGIEDKNGTPIYTGDLIKITVLCEYPDEQFTMEQVCRVMWSDEKMAVVCDWGSDGFPLLYQILDLGETTLEYVGKVFDEEHNTTTYSD